jgi:hypothetical protein
MKTSLRRRRKKMKKLILLGLLMGFFTPVLAMAQSEFDGTWKIDLNKTVMPNEPDVFLLQNGNYQCKTCVPVINVKADGEDHSVTGNPYYDTISIKVLDDRSIQRTEKKNGKTVATSKLMVSPDGNTATFEFNDGSNTNTEAVVGKGTMTRVAKSKRPAGSHAISGSWRTSKMESVSDNALLFTFKVEDGRLSMTSPTGQSYAAKLDGTDAPYKGDPGIDNVSILVLSKETFVETDKRNGKAVKTRRVMAIPAGGNTLNLIVGDPQRGTSVLYMADKQ